MLTVVQQIVLGMVQGITEWIPISSSAAMVLILSNFFEVIDLSSLITTALFFHLGTFFAALVYLRKDVVELTKSAFNYKFADEKNKKTLKFLLLSTLVSGVVGIVLLKTLLVFESEVVFTGKTISFFVGVLLLFTGVLQIKVKRSGLKKERSLNMKDGLLLGVVQGFAALPGISRSGITMSTLLLKKFDDTTALRLSVLMSLPIVLGGNLILNYQDVLLYGSVQWYGILTAFVFGILTIHGLMKVSKKINFGWFVIGFSILMMLSVFV